MRDQNRIHEEGKVNCPLPMAMSGGDGGPAGGKVNCPLSIWMRIACAVMLRDPDIIRGMPRLERHQIVFDLICVVLIVVWQVLVWTYSLKLYEVPLFAAAGVGVIVAFLIATIEIRLISGDLNYRGVLSTANIPREDRTFKNSVVRILKSGVMLKFLGRLVIAFILSLTTSQAIIGFWLKPDADQVIAQERRKTNVLIGQQYDAKKEMLRSEYLSGLDSRLADLRKDVEDRRETVFRLTRERDAEQRFADDAETERQRQELGYQGAYHGCKDKCWAAERKRDAHRLAAKQKQDAIDQENTLINQKEERIRQLDGTIAGRYSEYMTALKALESERKENEEKHYPPSILMTHLGMQKLTEDPKLSGVVKSIYWSALFFILTLEISFFLGRILGAPSAYPVLYNNRLMVIAAQSSHDTVQEIAASREIRRPVIQGGRAAARRAGTPSGKREHLILRH
jgi:hypothetical protein